ncbi:MAG: hypothetical protein IJ710_10200 [Prevotella sp.]|nr:hypothetical protein [Prevotella sp.]
MISYIIQKEKNSSRPSAGKYVARAVHDIVSNEQIEQEIQHVCSATPADVKLVLTALSDALRHHLQNGHIVKLDGIGQLKLELVNHPASTLEEFRADRNIKGVRLCVVPESRNGRQKFYDGVKFRRLE